MDADDGAAGVGAAGAAQPHPHPLGPRRLRTHGLGGDVRWTLRPRLENRLGGAAMRGGVCQP